MTIDAKKSGTFIKSTVIGGIVFLIPLGVVMYLLGKVVVVMKHFANALAPAIPVDRPIGVLALNLAALAALVAACFVAGLVAQRAAARQLSARVESTLLGAIPGYSFFKAFVDNMQRSNSISESFIPVLVQFDDYSQLAFEIEREPNGKAAIYLPGAPNPWSGAVVYVGVERVRHLPMSLKEALTNIRMLGKGSADVVARLRAASEAGAG